MNKNRRPTLENIVRIRLTRNKFNKLSQLMKNEEPYQFVSVPLLVRSYVGRRVCINLCMYGCIWMHACADVCAYACMYVRENICMLVCMCVYAQ